MVKLLRVQQLRAEGGTEAELVVSRWLSKEVNFRRKVEVV